jgi:hypothetical protein
VIAVVLAGCGSSDEQASDTTTSTEDQPSEATTTLDAASVASDLKAAGVPISYDVTELETSDTLGEGMQSTVATATDNSDITIEVYDTPAQSNEARLALIDLPGNPPVFVAQCGHVLIYIPEVASAASKQRQERKQIQQALESIDGPC